MIAMPAIDLREGACVQLVGGRYDEERIRLPDPAAVALRWREAGFTELHVVDLDAATGRGDNSATIVALIAGFRSTGVGAIQVGGGMGRTDRIEAAIAAGADRIVVGTRAFEDPAWLGDTARALPGRIVVAADVRGREVVTRGWAGSTGRTISDLLGGFDPLPLAGVLVTAVHVEGQLAGPDVELVREVVALTRHPVQASGGIRDLADLRALAAAGAARAVIGMALYTGRLDAEGAAQGVRDMSVITRKTKETTIRLEITRGGAIRVDTSVPFLDHMMVTWARYARLGLDVTATGDLRHHLIEDVAIVTGLAVKEEFAGPIRRYGHQVIPMDDAVVECALDLGGRPYYRGPLPSSLYDHWMRSFSDHAECTLHLLTRRGTDRHHIVEAGFKAFGMALAQAIEPAAEIASTKGSVRVGK